MKKIFLTVTIIACILLASVQVQAISLIISGSTSVNNFVFFGKEAELAKKLDIAFEVQPDSSGRGLLALHQNKADVAMISSELDVLVEEIGRGLLVEDFVAHKINETEVLFTVHKDNPVAELSLAQIQGVLKGSIRDWGELGIDGLGSIVVVTEHPTGGVYNTVINKVLEGAPILTTRITMQNGPQVGLVVSQNKNAIGMVSAATPSSQLEQSKLIMTPEVNAVQKLYLVTRRDDNRSSVLRFVRTIQGMYGK